MIKVVGFGNTLRGDDGVGAYVARALEEQYELSGEVEVEELAAPGLELVHRITGIDALILVDAVNDGSPPGTVTVYRQDEIVRITPARHTAPHAPSVTESLALAEMAGGAPTDVLLIGVSGGSYGMGEPMSAAVRAAVPEAIKILLRELEARGVACRRKVSPAAKEMPRKDL
jgi:hydrogenase maturation protease